MRRFASFITSLLVLSLLHGVSGHTRALADTCALGWEPTSFTDPTFEAHDVIAQGRRKR